MSAPLTPVQVEALQRCMAALENVHRLVSGVNAAIVTSGLPVPAVLSGALCNAYSDLRQALEAHDMAASKAACIGNGTVTARRAA